MRVSLEKPDNNTLEVDKTEWALFDEPLDVS